MNIITNQFHPSMLDGGQVTIREADPDEVLDKWQDNYKVHLMGPQLVIECYETDLNIEIKRNNSTRPAQIREGDSFLVGIPNRKLTPRNIDEMILWYLVTA